MEELFFIKSLKAKLILVILVLVIVSSLLTVTLALFQSFNVTEQIITTSVQDRLTSADNMLKTYLGENFGSLGLNNKGELVDEVGKSIAGNFGPIDQFAQDMGVVVTVFAKDGNDFTRVLTNIRDDKGERVIGTKLDPNGQAHQNVSRGQAFFGEANILGI